MKPLHGNYHVKPTPTALKEAWELANRNPRDYFRLEAEAMQLAWFPGVPGTGPISEIDPSFRIHRYEVGRTIAGQNNLRIVFWPAKSILEGDRENADGMTLPRLWILRVYQKKKQGYEKNDVVPILARRQIVAKRHYEGVADP